MENCIYQIAGYFLRHTRFTRVISILLLMGIVSPAAQAVNANDPHTRFFLLNSKQVYPFTSIRMYLYDSHGKLVYKWHRREKKRVLWRWNPGPPGSTIKITAAYTDGVLTFEKRHFGPYDAHQNTCIKYDKKISVLHSTKGPHGNGDCTDR
jgi:hypothetical protein